MARKGLNQLMVKTPLPSLRLTALLARPGGVRAGTARSMKQHTWRLLLACKFSRSQWCRWATLRVVASFPNRR